MGADNIAVEKGDLTLSLQETGGQNLGNGRLPSPAETREPDAHPLSTTQRVRRRDQPCQIVLEVAIGKEAHPVERLDTHRNGSGRDAPSLQVFGLGIYGVDVCRATQDVASCHETRLDRVVRVVVAEGPAAANDGEVAEGVQASLYGI